MTHYNSCVESISIGYLTYLNRLVILFKQVVQPAKIGYVTYQAGLSTYPNRLVNLTK